MSDFSTAIPGVTGHSLVKLGARFVSGDLNLTAFKACPPDQPEASGLVFLGESSPLEFPKNSIVVIKIGLTAPSFTKNYCLLEVPNIKAFMAQVLPFLDKVGAAFPFGISRLSSISPSAFIDKEVRVGAFSEIQDQVSVGQGTWIGSRVSIEAGAQIGANCQIHSGVVIGYDCIVGDNCILHANTVIGSDGFGFVPSKNGFHMKISQTGKVEIGRNVEFGANCAVDRATLGSTRIGDGCKFDNLCHVAHNVQIGKHGLFAGGFFVSGSTTIGDRFTCGGNVVIADHVHITDEVSLGGLSAVTKDIDKPGAYCGYPLEPMSDGLRTAAGFRHLTDMRRRLNKIFKHLGLDKDSTQ